MESVAAVRAGSSIDESTRAAPEFVDRLLVLDDGVAGRSTVGIRLHRVRHALRRVLGPRPSQPDS